MIEFLKIALIILAACFLSIAVALTATIIFSIVKYNKGYKKVTTCRECQWYMDDGCAMKDEAGGTQEDDYCSFAERREKR